MTDTPDLRDRFAMAALPLAGGWFGYKPENARKIAGMSYDIAKAMMAERDRLASLVGRVEQNE